MDYIIYTFDSSNIAYLALDLIEKNSVRARLVPLLAEIDAGCGLCLRFEEKDREKVENIIEKSSLLYKERYRLIYKDRKPEVLNYDLS
ncbi:DUF3343 domain-containing protein [Anaerococcus porci]|uniref:DUF3343 domain-containing protein n=1 Tax=Anaerococcus porci TaxID=2652269 RepID=A0A6N7VEN7_9FIRM|nr:DUF3343 domain-containing protein [Anaerococcus porci]MDY3005695.1 DUF3343 domain-containing protein [Anaerococcus porci]MSS77918.1 DUF3343 domain-containing protein [Anaerococcus porci]